MPSSPIIAAAYIRVSTDDQTELSPDSQLLKIREYAKAHGFIVPDAYVYHDDGISGRSTTRRKGFNAMIADAKSAKKPFDAILVWKFSRFARNREDSIVFKSMLKKRGIDVLSVSEPVGDDKMSILVESLIEAMDEYYSVNLSEEVRRGLAEKIRRGQPISTPPIGYVLRDGKLCIDPETAPIVRRIFSEYLAGKYERAIAADLNRDGIRTRRGKKFENRTVQYILRNPTYFGFVRCDFSGRGSRGMYRDGTEQVVRGGHEPLFDENVFAQLQQRVSEQKAQSAGGRQSPANRKSNSWALRGLLRCSACGGTLCYAANRDARVQCYNYSHGKCTVSHSATVRALTDAVLQGLRDALREDVLHLHIEPRPKPAQPNFEKMLQKENEKLARIKEAYAAGVDSLKEYKEQKNNIEASIASIRKQQAAASLETVKTPEAVCDLRNNIKTAIQYLESTVATEDEKNAVLRSFISHITYSRPTNSISIFFFA